MHSETCFVCLEAGSPLHRVCRCNLVVHDACFSKLIETVPSHETGCPVCLHSYRLADASSCTLPLVWGACVLVWCLGVLLDNLFYFFCSAILVAHAFLVSRRRTRTVAGAARQWVV